MNLTYTKLTQQMRSYTQRDDEAFLEEIPSLVTLAENRLATDMKQQGFQAVVNTELEDTNVMAKPAFWRETISMGYTVDGVWQGALELRTLEYIRQYWPNTGLVGAPKFYADYNINNFYIAPTPSEPIEIELVYYARLQPLDDEHQENWMTLNAPQALLAACLAEAFKWVRDPAQQQVWNQDYATAVAGLVNENAERIADRNITVSRP